MYRNLLCIGLILVFLSPLVVAQNDKAKTNNESEIPTCKDLLDPESSQDVQALRECIRAKKIARQQKDKNKKIQSSVERDRQLRESRLGPFCIFEGKKNPCDRIPPPPAN